MQKVPLITRHRQAGFSLVEALLAIAVFGLLSSAIIGAIIYGRAATASSGDHARAAYLADEGIEAVRNIRGAGYANLVDGTYGIAQSANAWTLSGTSDTSGIYTRSVTIASNGSNRKTVTSHVAWTGTGSGGQIDVTTELANWKANFAKSWATPSQYSSLDLSGTIAGYKVDTTGSYAYIVRNSATGPNFFVVNISTPTAPTVVGSMTLAGTPTNISVSGNYAYVSNASSTAELQIVNIATPATPTLAGTYNAAGNAGGLGVYAVGTTIYLTRSANGGNDEFVVINAATPAAPVRISGYSLNVNMYEVYVSGGTVVIATGSDTQEIITFTTALGLLTLGGSINLPGTVDATTVAGYGANVVVGQGTVLHTFSSLLGLLTVGYSDTTLPGTINDLAVDAADNLVFAGTNYANGEFQVVNIANTSAPTLYSNVNVTGSFNLTGVAYNSTYNVVPGALSNTAAEAVVFGPN